MKGRQLKFKSVIFGILAFLFVTSNIMISPSKVSYGYYCGMCDHRCADIYTLEDGQLTLDTASFFRSHYSNNSIDLKSDTSISLDNWEYMDFELKLPLIMFFDPFGPMGCPDCYDQCGIYFETVAFGLKRSYKIDPRRSPWYYKGLTKELNYRIKKAKGKL